MDGGYIDLVIDRQLTVIHIRTHRWSERLCSVRVGALSFLWMKWMTLNYIAIRESISQQPGSFKACTTIHHHLNDVVKQRQITAAEQRSGRWNVVHSWLGSWFVHLRKRTRMERGKYRWMNEWSGVESGLPREFITIHSSQKARRRRPGSLFRSFRRLASKSNRRRRMMGRRVEAAHSEEEYNVVLLLFVVPLWRWGSVSGEFFYLFTFIILFSSCLLIFLGSFRGWD